MTAAENELSKIEQQLQNGQSENAVLQLGPVLEVAQAASGMQLTCDEKELLRYVRELQHRILLKNAAPETVSREEARHLFERARPFIERRRGRSYPQPVLSPETISSVQRKYSQLGLSSEEFLQQKREDLELENYE